MKTILVGVTSSAVALAAASAAAAAAAFVTPAKAAYCGVSEGEPPFQLILLEAPRWAYALDGTTGERWGRESTARIAGITSPHVYFRSGIRGESPATGDA
jgi:hypothetical protein